ncbi:MAG: cytochrome c biogenesis protein ResB [Spirochaetes bacterium]|nr:cytochrome c biogenesis protein ResB [Spirochaetota bacterium]
MLPSMRPAGAYSIAFFLAFTAAVVVVHGLFRNSPLVGYISSTKAAVVSAGAFLVLVFLMGIFPQVSERVVASGNVPFLSALKHSRTFAMSALIILTSLGLAVLRRAAPFSRANLQFVLNHAGFYLIVLGMLAGSMDFDAVTMETRRNDFVWYGVNVSGMQKTLPIAMRLDRFYIEYYPADITVVDAFRKRRGSQRHVSAAAGKSAVIDQWVINVRTNIPSAGWAGGTFHDVRQPGAAPAAYIHASNTATAAYAEGWVSSGSFMQEPMQLPLDETHHAVLSAPQPKRYRSEITLAASNGQVRRAVLEVNKPVHIGGYTLYQTGFDERMGAYSDISIIQAVRDPWIYVVYTGIALLLIGSICMLFPRTKSGGAAV